MAELHPRDIVCLVLCAGKGTRMYPLTFTRPKHLLPLCNVPVIDHILPAIRDAGIRKVGVVISPDSRQLQDHVGTGHKWELDIQWIVQEEPRGIGDAVLVAEPFVNGRPFVVYLGDALYEGGIRGFVDRFVQVFPAALVRLAPVPDPKQYGVVLVENGVVKELEEKPQRPKSNLAITGLYAFPCEFFQALRRTPPSARGELEITDAVADLLAHSYCVEPDIWDRKWIDAGHPRSFLEANRLMLGWCGDLENAATVNDSTISGNVGADEGTEIIGSRLYGPVMIGRSCRIVHSHIGPNVCIGDGTRVRNAVVRDTVIDVDTVVCGVRCGLEASIVGRGSRVIGTARAGSPVSRLVPDNAEERIQ